MSNFLFSRQAFDSKKAASLIRKNLAYDAELDPDGWRTNKNGQHYHIDKSTGEIDAGMGGKFNGQKASPSPKEYGNSMRNALKKIIPI